MNGEMNMEQVEIRTEHIQLDQFLKLAGAVMTGGAVKPLLLDGCISVNGEKVTARRKRLSKGDVVTLETEEGTTEYRVS